MFEHANPALVVRFGKALDAVQNVAKTQTADTGKYSYSYADLGDVLEEVKRALRDYGLTVCQVPGYVIDGATVLMTVTTTIVPASTQIKAGKTDDDADGFITFPPMGLKLPGDAQAYGSALTYARRYSLLTIFGIAPEDDDGRAATVAATVQPGRRSEAERLIREEIGKLTDEQRPRFVADFKTEFGSSLTDLGVQRHGTALTWTKQWIEDEQWRGEAAAEPVAAAIADEVEGQQ
jgi:hypothetical protein